MVCLAILAFSLPHGFAGAGPSAKTGSKPAPVPAAAGPAGVRPNELGRLLILEYHLIGAPEAEWRRTPANFRKDLQLLYDSGYYPAPLADVVSGRLKVPAGKTPFVLTFDDSSQGQFRYLQEGERLVIDPQSAVGIMEQFKKEHPDFPLTATFYVLPAIPPKLRLFGQEEHIGRKLQYLAEHGYEIGSHTYWHQNLSKTDDLGVQKQMALANQAIQSYVPGYPVQSLSLPFGVHARNQVLEHDGEYQGIRYHYTSIVLVGSGPAPSPYAAGFNPYRLERIQAGDTAWGPGAYVERFRKNPALRFISDGDPATVTVPRAEAAKVGKLPPGMKLRRSIESGTGGRRELGL
ncbi:polysaccharide deacetylase [Hydrogenispora ethanolica]|uniref:Polysaccharide deacetylase n=2 Tax=Hydrogenispora ethanolica TaxID=1082276 RepID=A0A4R1R9Y4_HYDET|nr:polysaccharide deacetylase [Hydrogenispora ethanolica]